MDNTFLTHNHDSTVGSASVTPIRASRANSVATNHYFISGEYRSASKHHNPQQQLDYKSIQKQKSIAKTKEQINVSKYYFAYYEQEYKKQYEKARARYDHNVVKEKIIADWAKLTQQAKDAWFGYEKVFKNRVRQHSLSTNVHTVLLSGVKPSEIGDVSLKNDLTDPNTYRHLTRSHSIQQPVISNTSKAEYLKKLKSQRDNILAYLKQVASKFDKKESELQFTEDESLFRYRYAEAHPKTPLPQDHRIQTVNSYIETLENLVEDQRDIGKLSKIKKKEINRLAEYLRLDKNSKKLMELRARLQEIGDSDSQQTQAVLLEYFKVYKKTLFHDNILI